MKESDLYLPLKRFLESQGYEVKGEVKDCDVLAVRPKEDPDADNSVSEPPVVEAPVAEAPVIVELKLTLNLDVILQATDRLSLSPKVYIGVPRRTKLLAKRRKRIVKLLKMLGLGLIVIDPQLKTGAVDIVLDPGDYTPRKSKRRTDRLLGEFMRRVGDPNLGGSAKRKGLMTAYRQRALAIARFLEKQGPTKASNVAKNLADPKTRNILYRDVYGWFDRVSRGVYQLSPRGKEELPLWPADAGTIISEKPTRSRKKRRPAKRRRAKRRPAKTIQ